jgi:DnaJ family protein B protein 4
MDIPDFYAVMGLSKDATKSDIKRAYRTLAMKYHPDKRPEDGAEAKKKFLEITEAYKILIDDEDRKRYDSGDMAKKRKRTQYTRSVLDDLYTRFYGHDKIPNRDGPCSMGRSYQDPFFSPSREYVAARKFAPQSLPSYYGFEDQQPLKPEQIKRASSTSVKPKGDITEEDYLPVLIGEITVNVYLTVEEMFNGCTKVYNVTRCRDGNIEQKTCTVTVFPGTPEGTEIRGTGFGNKMKGKDPEDIVFVIKQITHAKYKVDGCDIIESRTVPMKAALLGFTLNITCLSGKTVAQTFEGPVQDGSELVIPGEGLTDQKTKEKGDYIVSICVQYPAFLTKEQREAVLSCFK